MNIFGLTLAVLATLVSPSDPDAARLEIERRVSASDGRIRAAQETLARSARLTDYKDRLTVREGEELWTDALQAALDENEIVIIPPRETPYFIDRPIRVPSRRRIEALGATISLAKGVTTLLLTTASAVDGTFSPVPKEGRVSDISVVGGRWCDNSVSRRGYGRSGLMNLQPRAVGNFYGVSTLFYFGNVERVSVTDATFVNCGGFAVQCGDGADFLFERLRFENCFADGLHLNGNLENVHAKDIRGKVGDDLVALNAYDWLDSSVNFGPQRTILCEDLELILHRGEGYPAIRIQPACYRYKDGSIVDCSISDVIFRRVRGITTFKMYLQTPRYRIGSAPEWSRVGSGGNIFFQDIVINLDKPIDRIGQYMTSDPVRGHFGAFEFGANLTRVCLENIDFSLPVEKFPLAHLAVVGPKSIRLPAKEGGADWEIFDPYVTSTVGELRLRNVRSIGASPAELVHATRFEDVNGDGCSTGEGRILRLLRD